MKRKTLRICHAIVRFDKIPHAVMSDILSRTSLSDLGDILEWEYLFRRYITVDKFERKLHYDIERKLCKEIKRLRDMGHFPVLYVDFYSGDLPYIRFELPNHMMHKLVQRRRGITLAFPSAFTDDELVINFSADFIKMLHDYNFSLEVV